MFILRHIKILPRTGKVLCCGAAPGDSRIRSGGFWLKRRRLSARANSPLLAILAQSTIEDFELRHALAGQRATLGLDCAC